MPAVCGAPPPRRWQESVVDYYFCRCLYNIPVTDAASRASLLDPRDRDILVQLSRSLHWLGAVAASRLCRNLSCCQRRHSLCVLRTTFSPSRRPRRSTFEIHVLKLSLITVMQHYHEQSSKISSHLSLSLSHTFSLTLSCGRILLFGEIPTPKHWTTCGIPWRCIAFAVRHRTLDLLEFARQGLHLG